MFVGSVFLISFPISWWSFNILTTFNVRSCQVTFYSHLEALYYFHKNCIIVQCSQNFIGWNVTNDIYWYWMSFRCLWIARYKNKNRSDKYLILIRFIWFVASFLCQWRSVNFFHRKVMIWFQATFLSIKRHSLS